jgi:pyrroloquinoline quinone biosynthesis protein E
MWTVVQRKNVHQLEALVDLAKEAGFANMVFSLDMHGWANDEMFARNREEMVEETIDIDRLFGLIDQGRSLELDVWFWNVGEKYATDTPKDLCPWPFERAFISSDLRCVPCCMISNPDEFEIEDGCSDDRTLSDIWNGETYREFRQAHLDGAIPDVCKSCYK